MIDIFVLLTVLGILVVFVIGILEFKEDLARAKAEREHYMKKYNDRKDPYDT